MERIRKHSRKRDAILACIRGTDCHPTADWIYSRLRPEIPDLSLGTVYRNLTVFREEGLIQSVGTVDGLEHFDGNVSPHSHFVCTCCGRFLDLPAVMLPASLIEEAGNAVRGRVETWGLRFSGICGSCTESSAERG